VLAPGGLRSRIARTLTAAYSGGLLSDDTFAARLDELMESRVLDPRALIGDLNFRLTRAGWVDRLHARLTDALANVRTGGDESPARSLLGLDWSGAQAELLIGRHDSCDVVFRDPSVSRKHARLVFRDHKWIVQDLRSTNGTIVNGVRVGRCELRPGDRLVLGDTALTVD
jgi:hypothetical protein